jgi:hypothetical protein
MIIYSIDELKNRLLILENHFIFNMSAEELAYDSELFIIKQRAFDRLILLKKLIARRN